MSSESEVKDSPVAKAEGEAAPEKVAKAEAEATPDKAAKVEGEAAPKKAAKAESEAAPKKAARAEGEAAPKKAAKVDGEAGEVKKAKAPEPEVKAEDMADANALFKKIFEAVEIQRRADRALLDEVERGHARLLQRVRDEAKDMEAWEKKALKAITDFGGAGQLAGGEARLLQLHNKLWSIRELLDAARSLR